MFSQRMIVAILLIPLTVGAVYAGGWVYLALILAMGNTHAKLLLSLDQSINEIDCIKGIIATYNAYMAAIERVLGAPEKTLSRLEDGPVRQLVSALRGKPQA